MEPAKCDLRTLVAVVGLCVVLLASRHHVRPERSRSPLLGLIKLIFDHRWIFPSTQSVRTGYVSSRQKAPIPTVRQSSPIIYCPAGWQSWNRVGQWTQTKIPRRATTDNNNNDYYDSGFAPQDRH